jgi:hypothetical protein
VFNTSNEAKTIEIIKKGKKDYKDILNNEKVTNNGNKISLTLKAKSSVILR